MGDSRRIITLLSDFGLRDHFVAAMKGVMLSLNPDVTLVDISHQIPPQDIFTGAFTLGQAYSCFPSGHDSSCGRGSRSRDRAQGAGGYGRRALLCRAGQRHSDLRVWKRMRISSPMK